MLILENIGGWGRTEICLVWQRELAWFFSKEEARPMVDRALAHEDGNLRLRRLMWKAGDRGPKDEDLAEAVATLLGTGSSVLDDGELDAFWRYDESLPETNYSRQFLKEFQRQPLALSISAICTATAMPGSPSRCAPTRRCSREWRRCSAESSGRIPSGCSGGRACAKAWSA
jgi:hypothetical protein